MRNFYFLIFPVILGFLTGLFLIWPDSDNDNTQITISKLKSGGSPILGNENSPITILEWGDYQCTFCYKFHQDSLNKIIEEYVNTGRVNLVFKDFPLNGPDSILAAEASYCANEQKKYWSYHNELYKNWAGERTGWITKESLKKFAHFTSLDVNKFEDCLENRKFQNKVLEIEKFGKEIGIDATPSFLIFNNNEIIKIRGNQPIEVFQKVISELESK